MFIFRLLFSMADMRDFLTVMGKELQGSNVRDIKYLLEDSMTGKFFSFFLPESYKIDICL